MKTSNFWMAGAVAVTMLFTACGGGAETSPTSETTPETETEAAPETAAAKMDVTIDAAASMVGWKGSVAGVKDHTGTLKFTEGTVSMEGEAVVGGSLTVDMASMAATDENYNEEHTSEMLIGHLSSEDFFNVAEFPTATFKITGMDGSDIAGELTLHGKTNAEKVTNITMSEEDGKKVVSGDLTFNRQNYDVVYGIAGDMIISDDIELNVKLVAGGMAAAM